MTNARRLLFPLLFFFSVGCSTYSFWGVGSDRDNELSGLIITEPKQYTEVASPVKVCVWAEKKGRQYLIVDKDIPEDLTQPISEDGTVFMGGVCHVIELPMGQHSLKVLMVKDDLVPFDPLLMDSVDIRVIFDRKES